MLTTKQSPIRINFYLGLLLLLSITLASCGFHLKQSAAIPTGFGPVSIAGISEYSSLYKIIRNALRQSDIQIVNDDTANHTVVISNLKNERHVLSVNSAGKVSEYELIKTLTFRVLDRNGRDITDPQTISTNRAYSVSSNTETVGESLEEADIYLSMEEALVDRMFRYISGRI